MTPNELYALPTIRTEPFQEFGHELMDEVLGISIDIDEGRAEAAGEARVTLDMKLDCNFDYERGASVSVLALDGRGVAYLATAGRGGHGYRRFVVTDAEGLEAARRHVLAFAADGQGVEPNDPALDDEGLDGFYGAVTVVVGDEVRLVERGRLSDDGSTLLFDDVAYREAFDRLVRPISMRGNEAYESGLASEEISAAAADAILAAVPEGIEAVRVGGWRQSHEDRDAEWIGAAVVVGDECYAIGVSPWQAKGKWFSWGSGVGPRLIGTAEAIEQFRPAATPAP